MSQQPRVPLGIYKAVYIIIVIAVLLYIIHPGDAIPEKTLKVTPAAVTAFLDDFAVIIGGIIVARKWRGYVFPTKKSKKIQVPAATVYVIAIIVWLLYVFWVGDIIHDQTPYAGWFDDAAAFFLMMAYSHRIKRRLWGKE